MRIADSFRVALIGAAAASLALGIASSANAESAYDKQQRKEAEIPTCSHQIGTLAGGDLAAIFEPHCLRGRPRDRADGGGKTHARDDFGKPQRRQKPCPGSLSQIFCQRYPESQQGPGCQILEKQKKRNAR